MATSDATTKDVEKRAETAEESSSVCSFKSAKEVLSDCNKEQVPPVMEWSFSVDNAEDNQSVHDSDRLSQSFIASDSNSNKVVTSSDGSSSSSSSSSSSDSSSDSDSDSSSSSSSLCSCSACERSDNPHSSPKKHHHSTGWVKPRTGPTLIKAKMRLIEEQQARNKYAHLVRCIEYLLTDSSRVTCAVILYSS